MRVKEIHKTIQGEGFHAGKTAVFVRFSGCNIWSGREKDRARDAKKGFCAQICDTDFVGTNGLNGGKFEWLALVDQIERIGDGCKFVVFTGGEPLLQLSYSLIKELQHAGYYVSVETNGSVKAGTQADWITLSPKPPMPIKIDRFDEVKVLFPFPGDLDQLRGSLKDRCSVREDCWWLQPIDGANQTKECVKYAMDNGWRLSVQTHKVLGIP